MDEQVLIWALGRDGPLTCGFLTEFGFHCEAFRSWDALEEAMLAGVGAVIVAAELLSSDSIAQIRSALQAQPPWSDLPLVIVAGDEFSDDRLRALADELGNVYLLHRPVSLDTLATTIRSALRARRRQYEVRDLLRQREESERRKDEFLAMLAHELRNPLAPVRTGLEVLKLDPPAEAAQRTRAMLERQVSNLARLVDDLLDVSRITRGKISLDKRVVGVADVLAQALESAARLAAEKGCCLEVAPPTEPLLIDADPTRLEQIVGNVLNNAIKFTPPHGHIRLSARREGPWALIEVKDTGAGIPPGVLGQVFELFAQADRTLDRSQGGLGIGLTVVRSLARLHGGDAEIFSEGEGKGASVLVRLPALEPAAERPSVADSEDYVGSGRSRRILIIEDNRDAAEMLAVYLQGHGHQVFVAHDGNTGIAAARRHRPECVVCDIGLPGMDGYAVVKALRDEPELRGCLFIALTGYGDSVDRERACLAGFHQHLTKPADPRALARIVAQAVPMVN